MSETKHENKTSIKLRQKVGGLECPKILVSNTVDVESVDSDLPIKSIELNFLGWDAVEAYVTRYVMGNHFTYNPETKKDELLTKVERYVVDKENTSFVLSLILSPAG